MIRRNHPRVRNEWLIQEHCQALVRKERGLRTAIMLLEALDLPTDVY